MSDRAFVIVVASSAVVLLAAAILLAPLAGEERTALTRYRCRRDATFVVSQGVGRFTRQAPVLDQALYAECLRVHGMR